VTGGLVVRQVYNITGGESCRNHRRVNIGQMVRACPVIAVHLNGILPHGFNITGVLFRR
jgi:hypothetical protein